MRRWMVALLLLAPAVSPANSNLMSAGDVRCPQYLALVEESAEKARYESWVAGRVAAIVPSNVQTALRKISLKQLQADIKDTCLRSDPEFTLFDISAMLAHEYRQEQPG